MYKKDNKSVVFKISLLFLFSFIFSIIGLSLSYDNFLDPQNYPNEFKSIGYDGWITNDSKIELKNLNDKANRLELDFNSWRPDGKQGGLVVRVCGEKRGEFFVTKDNEKVVISLNGICNPKVIEFETLNPIKAGANDSRMIGTKLQSAKVTSKLGLVLVNKKIILITSLLVFLFSLVTYFALLYNFSFCLAFVIPILLTFLFYFSYNFNLIKIYSLFTFLIWIFIGLASWRLFFKQKKYFFNDDYERQTNVLYSVLIFIIMILGALIRYRGIDFGLPLNFHPDEVRKIMTVRTMHDNFIAGNANAFFPDYFLHPTLLLYLTYIVSTIFSWVIPDANFADNICLAGRIVSFIAGTFSIYLIYYVGRRLFSPIVGIMASLFLAFCPLHIACSRYLKEDSLLVFFFLACICFVIKAVKEDKLKYYFLAAIMAGGACATKYTGILSFAILFFAPFFKSGSIFKIDKKYFLVSPFCYLLVVLTFMVLVPYSVINVNEGNKASFLVNDEGKISLNKKFVNDFNSEKRHATRGHTVPITANSEFWMYHFRESIKANLFYPLTAIALIGVGILIKRRRIEDLFILYLICLFYFPIEYVKSKPAPQPDRYILPCIPFLAIAASEFIRIVALSRHFLASLLLFCVALFFPINKSLSLAKDINNDTRIQMAEYIKNNLKEGSFVFIDYKRYGPYLPDDKFNFEYIQRARIMEKLNIRELRSGKMKGYLVLSSLFYDRYYSQPAPTNIRDIFKRVFKYIPIVKEISAPSGTYAFHNPTLTLFSLRKKDIAKLDEELKLQKEGKILETSNEKKTLFFKKYYK